MRRAGHLEHRQHERLVPRHSPILAIVITKVGRIDGAIQKRLPGTKMRRDPGAVAEVVPGCEGLRESARLDGSTVVEEAAAPRQPNLRIGISLNDALKYKAVGEPVIAVNGDADIVVGDLRTRQDMEIRSDLVKLLGMVDDDDALVTLGQSRGQPVGSIGGQVVQNVATPVTDGLFCDSGDAFANERKRIVQRRQDSQHARLQARLGWFQRRGKNIAGLPTYLLSVNPPILDRYTSPRRHDRRAKGRTTWRGSPKRQPPRSRLRGRPGASPALISGSGPPSWQACA